jgi:hypothetical protein
MDNCMLRLSNLRHSVESFQKCSNLFARICRSCLCITDTPSLSCQFLIWTNIYHCYLVDVLLESFVRNAVLFADLVFVMNLTTIQCSWSDNDGILLMRDFIFFSFLLILFVQNSWPLQIAYSHDQIQWDSLIQISMMYVYRNLEILLIVLCFAHT